MPEAARRGGSGRKLQEPEGLLETRVKISDMRRCWIEVSLEQVSVYCDDAEGDEGKDIQAGCRIWSAEVALGR